MPVTCFLNQKGGVSKTSTCYHLSGTLSLMGQRVLLVDNDPQASLTQGFLGPDGMRALAPGETVAAIYAGDAPFPAQVIRPTGFARIDLVAGSKHATEFNVPEPHRADPSIQAGLREFLAEVRGSYDQILIDCCPNLHLFSWAALVASDRLIVPLGPEDFGSQGISEVQDSVDLVLAGPNPRLELAGYLVTRYNNRRAIHKHYETMLRSLYGDDVFATVVPDSTDFVEAVAYRKPVAFHKPKGPAAKVMKELAGEMITRGLERRVA